MSQERQGKSSYETSSDEVEVQAPDKEKTAEDLAQAAAKKAELDESTDTILDDIDGILEANAEEFVQNFVQKGGE